MAIHNQTGKQGEQIANRYLQHKGYEILDENWVCGKAEIDIIALYNRQIVFVEVKTRTSTDFGMPEDFVTNAKQKQMELAANKYIELKEHAGEIRFDIIAVFLKADNTFQLKHIEDAFWPMD